ncbi:MAG: glycosyltransferase [Culicoidibacterales bacterium]
MANLNNSLVSVIMGIYNCEQTLAESIESILEQTYSNWELIMCDDGSTDKTLLIAKQYKESYPEKIKVIQNEQNMGLNFTLNHCLKYAKGTFVARQDGDDISKKNRFEKQLAIFNQNENISIVSSAMEYFDESGVWATGSPIEFPTEKQFLGGTPFAHAAAMVKKSAFEQVKGYTESKWLLRVEDCHLWMKMYQQGLKGINILEPLYMMRDDRNASTRRKKRYRINEVYMQFLACKTLKMPLHTYIYVIKPIILMFLPIWVYEKLHRMKVKKS